MRAWINLFESETQWPQSINGSDLARCIRDQRLHHTPEDFDHGDIYDKISSFGRYDLRTICLSGLRPDLYLIDDDLVDDYARRGNQDIPPIVYDPRANLVIDGNHRVKAAIKRGEKTILAYVGDPATYVDDDDDDDDLIFESKSAP